MINIYKCTLIESVLTFEGCGSWGYTRNHLRDDILCNRCTCVCANNVWGKTIGEGSS